MNDISIYLIKLHNSMQYRTFSQATAGYSVIISRKLAEISEQDMKHAEIFFASGQEETSENLRLNPFDVNLEGEAADYTPEILAIVVAEEEYLAKIFKQENLKSLYNASIHRAVDIKELADHLRDGSLFGHTVNCNIRKDSRKDCVCSACGYMHRHLVNGPQYFPEECPMCGAPQGLFVRRTGEVGGW